MPKKQPQAPASPKTPSQKKSPAPKNPIPPSPSTPKTAYPKSPPTPKTPVTPPATPAKTKKTYTFMKEFNKRNSLIDALKFALKGTCNCEACRKLKVFADVLEEDAKEGKIPEIMPK